jgi:hypothetical protein
MFKISSYSIIRIKDWFYTRPEGTKSVSLSLQGWLSCEPKPKKREESKWRILQLHHTSLSQEIPLLIRNMLLTFQKRALCLPSSLHFWVITLYILSYALQKQRRKCKVRMYVCLIENLCLGFFRRPLTQPPRLKQFFQSFDNYGL